MIFLSLFFSLWSFAATQALNDYEKSFPRDNTFCSHKEQRIEIQIRGSSKFVEPKERGYGEYIFYKRLNEEPKLLPLTIFQSDTFRLFLGTSPLCSKSHGYILSPDIGAVLFLKENRPFKDMLAIQIFDLKTLTPKEFVVTNFYVDKVEKTSNGFAFRTFNDGHNLEVGKVLIDGAEYIFNEKDFPHWVGYSQKGFEGMGEMSFEKFLWKNYFKNINDFYEASGWNEKMKLFSRQIIYVAVNHQLKKRCLFITDKKTKPQGNEPWRCQTI
jgi:hypothetical protein